MDYEIASPDPGGTISSLSSLGYTLEAAIADIVDNSIAAEARRVDVTFHWDGAASWIAIADNGRGMAQEELTTAMTIAARGPDVERDGRDLGRFGMGLKTASFSQADTLTVLTRATGAPAWTSRTWDLGLVRSTREWRLLTGLPAALAGTGAALTDGRARGTIVVWTDLGRLVAPDIETGDETAHKAWFADMDRCRAHLSMVFQRYLATGSRLVVTVNGERVAGWDPFMSDNTYTQRLPPEDLPLDGSVVSVAPFVLPHHRHLDDPGWEAAAGPRGWLEQEGFYVYRRDRLIVAGGWLGLGGFRRDERHLLARIAVDVPANLDGRWAVDVRKSSATPPAALRAHLTRLAQVTREAAARVLMHRGRVASTRFGETVEHPWRVERRGGSAVCRLNREHPLIVRVLRGEPSEREPILALLRLLEETVPLPTLRVMRDAEDLGDPEPFLDAAPTEVAVVAKAIRDALVDSGRTVREANAHLRRSAPFDTLDGFWQED